MDGPVRIDLWGDEVDRLTSFAVADQRSTDDLDDVEIFGCREVLPTDDVRERAAQLAKTAPWGLGHWERLAEGHTFDGMESWLPWLTETEHVIADLLPPDALVLLFDPRRMRDRAADLLAEEASLAGSLAKTWGVPEGDAFPPLHLPFDRLLAHTAAPVWSVTATGEGPDTPTVEANAWDPLAGDPTRLVERLKSLSKQDYRIVVAADGEGSAARIAGNLRDEGFVAPEVVIAPLERGVILPSSKLALLAEPDITGRRRAHRAAKPRARATAGFFDDMAPGSFVVHHHHGVARYAGMVTRTIGGIERDYLLLEYRGDDKLLRPERPDRHAAAVLGRRDPDAVAHGRRRLRQGEGAGQGGGARDRARARRAVPAPHHVDRPRLPARLGVAARVRGRLRATPRRPTS